jgi:hypothetical protein
LLPRLFMNVNREDFGTSGALLTLRDEFPSMWREQVEGCIVTRWNKLIVDEQLCFDWTCHCATCVIASLGRRLNYKVYIVLSRDA